jgi:lambda repressor-like predicted transcriptional regulator
MEREEIARIVTKYRPYLNNKILCRFPSVDFVVIQDAYSEACYQLLINNEKVNQCDIIYSFLGIMMQEVCGAIREKKDFSEKVIEGKKHREPISLDLFDLAFYKFLTSKQKKLYKLRVLKRSIAEISRETGLTPNGINVLTGVLLKKYIQWKKKIEGYKSIDPEPLWPYQRRILSYLIDGFTIQEIALKMGCKISSVRNAMIPINKILQVAA